MKAKVKTKKQGWDFKKNGCTAGFIYRFINCREQVRLMYKELWTPRSSPLFREFGSCFHWLLLKLYSNKLKNLKGMIKTYDKLWKKENPNPVKKQAEVQQLIYGLCEKVMPEYMKRWNGDTPLGRKYKCGNNTIRPVKWINLEETWRIDYTTVDEDLELPMQGRFDGVFEDSKNKLWLFETKCLSVIYEEDILDLLPSDVQVMLYLLAIYLKYEKKPAGVLYNIVRRPGLRQGVSETVKDFLVRVEKDVSNPKRYEHYFKRYEMAIDWSEVETWRKEFLDVVLMEIRDWASGDGRHWINPTALTSKYGRCEMFQAIVKNNYVPYFKRKFVFSELQDNM